MSASVIIPISILESIIEQLEDLDVHRCGYKFENALGDTMQKMKFNVQKIGFREACAQIIYEDFEDRRRNDPLIKELIEYLPTVRDITEDEKAELHEWVVSGFSVYDNPYTLSNDSGRTMDFIRGCRIGIDLRDNPSDYLGVDLDTENEGRNDELPF